MDFQSVRNINGQKDNKGYQKGVEMKGMIVSVEEKKFSDKGKPFQQVMIKDGPGETEKVKVYLGNGPDILPSDVNTLQLFTVSPNPYQNTMYYMGFWDSTHPPQGQPAPQQGFHPQGGNPAHAAPINAAMAANNMQYQPTPPPAWNPPPLPNAVTTPNPQQRPYNPPSQVSGLNKEENINLQSALKIAVRVAAIRGNEPNIAQICQDALMFQKFQLTGNMPQNIPAIDDQIAF